MAGPAKQHAQQLDVWIGRVEVRQLPGNDHRVKLSGKGAYTWITCWAESSAGYRARVAEVMADYGLFVVEADQLMPFRKADEAGNVTDQLFEQYEETKVNQNFCIFGTLHNYMTDN